MVLEVSSLTAPLDLFGSAWPCHKPATTEDDIGYAHHPRLQPAVAKHAAKERPIKRVKSDSEAAPCASPPLRGTSPSSRVRPLTASPTLVKAPEPCQLSPPVTPLPTTPAAYMHQDDGVATPTFSFTQILAPASGTFSFPSIVLAIRTGVVKRARPRSDVDGEHTAALSSKKRRLRLQLITSRLSRPYCSPASHILNRDAIVSGEKRFLKLASNAEAARRLPSVQSSLLHRAAVLNRVRLRVRSEVMERGGAIAVAGVPANAALLYQGLSHFTGARFVVSQSGLEGSIASQLAQQKKSTPKPRVPSACPVPPPIVTKSRPSPSPPGTPSMRAVDPRMRAATAPQAPRLRPLSSPELGPHRGPVIDDEHDEESAFPTSEHESRYESSDDPEEVYSDFSLIFGNPGDEIEEEEEYDEHSYEEYLEELDGIPWLGL